MLVSVSAEDSLNHIQTQRKILDAISMVNDKEGGSLGSDGETSDYQRSTPSPQDSNARITELSEGLEKADTESRHHLSSAARDAVVNCDRLEWKSNNSPPDLGFYDNFDNSSSSSPLYESRMPPFSDMSTTCHQRLSIPSDTSTNHVTRSSSSVKQTNTANTSHALLSKSLKVDLEKLPSVVTSPTVMTSMVTSKNHPSLMFKRSEEVNKRKRYGSTVGNNKKCPRYVSADQRKPSNKTIPGSKELLLHPNLFNSFRITKPKSNKTNSKCDSSATKCNNETKTVNNGTIHFEAQSFYKKSNNSLQESVSTGGTAHKQTDLITPASVPSSTVFSCKTESSSDRVSSKINLLQNDSDSLQSKEGSQQPAPSDDHHSGLHQEDDAVFALPNNPKKIRFPALPSSSAIQCKWEGCGECFKNHGNLSDHIKTTHVVGVESRDGDGPKYSCLWVGCKVYGKKSSSLKWLESHVPRHGGKFAYPCIVPGCKMRFSSQAMLERHVNNHFTESSTNSSQTGPRKSIEGATAKKRLKRAGVRLKFRQLPFSARIFDFFDAGVMSGVRHGVSDIEQNSARMFNMTKDEITFSSKIISMRKDSEGRRQVQLKWIPEDLIPDTWLPADKVTPTKTVKVCNLPETSKQKLFHDLLGQPVPRTKQSRKTKRSDDYNPFLTPSEAKQLFLERNQASE